MSKEWKDLEKGNISSDILVSDYDLKVSFDGGVTWERSDIPIPIVLHNIYEDKYICQYRKNVKRMPFGRFSLGAFLTVESIYGYLENVMSDGSAYKYKLYGGAHWYCNFEEGLPEAYLEVEE